LEPSVSGGDDFVGIGAPDEGFGLSFIVLIDEAIDGHLQIHDRVEHAVLQAPPCQLGEEPLTACPLLVL
jgi:hypothetical protein